MLKDYKKVCEQSLYQEEWIKNLYYDKENIARILESNNISYGTIKEFLINPNIINLIKNNKQIAISENLALRFFDAGKSKENIKALKEIYEQTLLNADLVIKLLNEYSQKTRDFIDAELYPVTENQKTWCPIKTFKIKNESIDSTIEIKNKTINCTGNEKLNLYFSNRNFDRTIKRGFLKDNQLNYEQYKNCRKSLISIKETKLNVNFCYSSNEECKYKILFKENQCVLDDKFYIPLFNDNIKVLQIMEI